MAPRGKRETAFALEAFGLYLQLPKPRELKRLVGVRPKTKSGALGKPFTYASLNHWSHRNNWDERARQFDEEVQAAEREKIVKWRIKEAERREKQRLQAAELQRIQAVSYLTYGEEDEAVEENPALLNAPKKLQECDPQYLSIANQFLKAAAETERADLGSVAKQQEEAARSQSGPVVVLTESGVEQLRELMAQIKQMPVPQPVLADPDVIDAQYEVAM